MRDVIWVNGDSKMKKLDPNKTFVKLRDKEMTLGSVSSPSEINSMENIHLFYIYYQPVEGEELKPRELLQFLSDELSNVESDIN